MQAFLATLAIKIAEKLGQVLMEALSKWLAREAKKKQISKKVDHAIKLHDKAQSARVIANMLSNK